MKIELTTRIKASIQVCFDLARDVDIHKLSTQKTNERAVAGRVSGLCELNDTITWEAKHFGIRQRLTVAITKMEQPYFFEDKMLKGVFKSMQHQHHFSVDGGETIMKDIFEFEAPLGWIGKLFNQLILGNYMTRFLKERNQILKSIAESK